MKNQPQTCTTRSRSLSGTIPGLVLALIIPMLISACGALGDDDDESPEEFWSPFNSQSFWEVGDGRILVELSGYERGHEPGKTAEFTVNVENRRDQPAELEVCAKLIDERDIVQRFDQYTVSIEPSSNQSTDFTATLDEDLEPRAYGLAVVIGDLGKVVHTIRVGIPDDEAGPWLDAEQLVCD